MRVNYDGRRRDVDLGFRFEARQNGEVAIFHRQRLAATLRGQAAQQFVAQVNELSDAALQQVMAASPATTSVATNARQPTIRAIVRDDRCKCQAQGIT